MVIDHVFEYRTPDISGYNVCLESYHSGTVIFEDLKKFISSSIIISDLGISPNLPGDYVETVFSPVFVQS